MPNGARSSHGIEAGLARNRRGAKWSSRCHKLSRNAAPCSDNCARCRIHRRESAAARCNSGRCRRSPPRPAPWCRCKNCTGRSRKEKFGVSVSVKPWMRGGFFATSARSSGLVKSFSARVLPFTDNFRAGINAAATKRVPTECRPPRRPARWSAASSVLPASVSGLVRVRRRPRSACRCSRRR